VAIKARGNQIGMITDLKTSCLAAGRSDLAYQLVTELQKALDSLKHEVEPDAKVIADIRQQVNPRAVAQVQERIADFGVAYSPGCGRKRPHRKTL
jgi:hypothetical protein